jgi:hypothetical protein
LDSPSTKQLKHISLATKMKNLLPIIFSRPAVKMKMNNSNKQLLHQHQPKCKPPLSVQMYPNNQQQNNSSNSLVLLKSNSQRDSNSRSSSSNNPLLIINQAKASPLQEITKTKIRKMMTMMAQVLCDKRSELRLNLIYKFPNFIVKNYQSF